MKKPVTSQTFRKEKGQRTNDIIRRFHNIHKELEKLKANPNTFKQKQLESELEAKGGIRAYQQASRMGASRFNSEKWLIKNLLSHSKAVSLLDVGALTINYALPQVQVTSIDLNPCIPQIKKMDFLDVNESYDVVCLSLVLNFTGCPETRAKMIQKCKSVVKKDGFVYIVLPLPCVMNSRHFSEDYFVNSLMKSVDFQFVKKHESKKLSFFIFQNSAYKFVDGLIGFSDRKRSNNFKIPVL